LSEFLIFFKLGIEHILGNRNTFYILETEGFDHILFVVVLCALYTFSDWKKVIILVTAFTIGHSITLALSVLDIIVVNSALVEFLIPITILATAISNLFKKERNGFQRSKVEINYFLALFFGLIHGLAFSNYLKALLGQNANITQSLLAFNIGLEVGQLVIVAAFLFITGLFLWFGVSRRDWRFIVSSAAGGIALILAMEAKYW
jgi:hypothetical protein